MNDSGKGFKILIIDDESQIRRLLRISLEANQFKVFDVGTGKEGMVSVTMNHPDVVLLDLGLPDEDGLEVLKNLREWSRVPVIVLTVEDSEPVKVRALDLGADDYVTKPFNTAELLARIRVAIRHSYKIDESPVFTDGELEVDLNLRLVKIKGQEIKLTALEYSILALFIRNAGKVMTHNYIIREIWGNPYAENAQILRVHVAQIRKKIEKNPSIPEILITESGVGYRLKVLS
ncbi:MAG: response regulator [Porphyromonadaceae bacterium]|nr:MAG: response regulator [Porphyromonadaceae bacterium]